MQVNKTVFITGCFGVDIVFYIKNKQSYNYLKNIRSFCVTRYIGPKYKEEFLNSCGNRDKTKAPQCYIIRTFVCVYIYIYILWW